MPKIRKPLRLLPLVALAPLLAACPDPEAVRSTPEPARFERVTITQPAGAAQCDDRDGIMEPCLSQAQADTLFNDVVDALCEADDRLAWLSDYYFGTTLNASCAEPPF